MTKAIVGLDNGLSSVRHQAIICISARLLSTEVLETNFNDNSDRNSNILIQENAFESIVWKIEAILSLPPCVNSPCPTGWYSLQLAVSLLAMKLLKQS